MPTGHRGGVLSNILSWKRRNYCTYASTRRSRGSTGSHWALSVKQRHVRCSITIDSEMIVSVYVCETYHGSRHTNGRRFIVVATRHLRGEVLEKRKQRYKYSNPSLVWHIVWKCQFVVVKRCIFTQARDPFLFLDMCICFYALRGLYMYFKIYQFLGHSSQKKSSIMSLSNPVN